MKELIKKLIPSFILNAYHYTLAILAKWIYDNPSGKMTVVGVTGTSGKSSTCYFIAQMLEYSGFKVGMTTTTLFKIGEEEWLNDKKMTMLGRFQTQKLLKRMAKAGCQVVVVETSSEGIKQYRHKGIDYDMVVFTNLYPEHIESHGSFEKYREAKGKLFAHLSRGNKKERIMVINIDDENAPYFMNFNADRKVTYGKGEKAEIKVEEINMKLLGEYNRYNVAAGVAVAREVGVKEEKIQEAIKQLKPLPGRLEFIENDLGIKIMVDYSFEPKAVEKLYETIRGMEYGEIIHVLGSTGGGRDRSRRPKLGQLADKFADKVIVTNEDPYDESPMKIIDEVAAGVKNKELFKILNRREAIAKALSLAKKGDLVLITGKGAEQAMVVKNNKKVKWDDRVVVREELGKIGK